MKVCALCSKRTLGVIFLCTAIMVCRAAEKQQALRQVKQASSLLMALERYCPVPLDLNKLICSYDIRPGIFISFFQDKPMGDDLRMERDKNPRGVEVHIFGVQRDTFLPVVHTCGLFTEEALEDSAHLGCWDKEQITDDLSQAFPEAPVDRRCLGMFKSPFDKPEPYPLGPQVSYNVVNMIAFLCRVNAQALSCDTQDVEVGQQISRLYLPPGVSIADWAQSIDLYITELQAMREKIPTKKFAYRSPWGKVLDTTIDAYPRLAPTIKTLLDDQAGKLRPVFWDRGSLGENVARVQKKRKAE